VVGENSESCCSSDSPKRQNFYFESEQSSGFLVDEYAQNLDRKRSGYNGRLSHVHK